MPNENRNRSALDTLCLKSVNASGDVFGFNPIHEAYKAIEAERSAKLERLNAWFDELEESKLSAHTLKKLVRWQRINAPSKTMRTCNTTPISQINPNIEAEPLTMNLTEYSYSMSGLNRCKNPFCSLCSRSRAGERAHRLKQGILGAMLKNYKVYFVTFTIPRSQSIEAQKIQVQKRWKRLNNLFQSWRRYENSEVYTAKALDITFNPYVKTARYHLHIHGIVITEKKIDNAEDRMIRAWLGGNDKDFRATYKAQDIQQVGKTLQDTNKVGRYVAKMAGLALEITHGQAKEAKSKNSWTLSEIMLQKRHDERTLHFSKAEEIYREFLSGMKKVRTLDVSRNWDDLFIDTEIEENELQQYQIEIPIDRWQLLKSDWVLIAEKVQFEIFQNSFLAGGSIDHIRINQILEDVENMIENLERRKDIIWILQTVWE